MKPIYLVFQEGVPLDMQAKAVEGIAHVLFWAGAEVQLKNLGVWRQPNWIDQHTGELTPHSSVDWYVEQGRSGSQRRPKQTHIRPIRKALWSDPYQKNQLHWDVTVVADDLYDDGLNFCLGEAVPDGFCIISTHRFMELDEFWRQECFKSTVMHELGHVFGLVDKNRQDRTVTYSIGHHCTNEECIMRQGLSVAEWMKHTQERLSAVAPFCRNCLQELARFFY